MHIVYSNFDLDRTAGHLILLLNITIQNVADPNKNVGKCLASRCTDFANEGLTQRVAKIGRLLSL